MPAQRNAFRLGLTLIVMFILALGVLWFLAPSGGGDTALQIRFPHHQFSTTLKPGSEIACGGQTVGSIQRMELREMEDPASGYKALYAVITASVDSSLGLRRDCKIVPEGPLLGGAGRLVILDRGLGKPVESGQMLEGQVAADFAALTRLVAAQLDQRDPTSALAMIKAQLNPGDPKSLVGKILLSLEDLNAVTSSIRNELDPRQKDMLFAKVHAILDHINQATRLLRDEMNGKTDAAMLAKVHKMLDSLNLGVASVVGLVQDNRQPITDTITHIRNTSEVLEQQIAARIAQQLDPQDAASLLAKVHVAIDRLGASLQDITVITQQSREAVVLTKPQMLDLVSNFKETSDHLKAASKEIRRNPWRLFYQPTLEEAAQANVFDAARAFSDAATKLDDVLGRLEALEQAGAVAPSRDKKLQEIRQQIEESFQQFRKVETALWEQLKIK